MYLKFLQDKMSKNGRIKLITCQNCYFAFILSHMHKFFKPDEG